VVKENLPMQKPVSMQVASKEVKKEVNQVLETFKSPQKRSVEVQY
jgi:hypothetical protein